MRLLSTTVGLICAGMILSGVQAAEEAPPQRRQIIRLDGTWQMAEGAKDRMPSRFDRRIPVPGLADMARPPFAEVGTPKSGQYRQAFWYRRTFTLDAPCPAVARLKIHKAMYGTRVFLNGKFVGEHLPCFTPAEFDVRSDLHGPGRENELVVCVGAHRSVLPKGMPDGADFEKFDYIPGIYDSVELILSGTPRVASVQAAPDVEGRAVRVVAVLEDCGNAAGQVTCRVREAATGKEVGHVSNVPPSRRLGLRPDPVSVRTESQTTNRGTMKSCATRIDVRIPIQGCRLWSPEDPFLYELEVATRGDVLRTRFGMRSFRLDPKSGRAVLNGKPYFLRGTNVCIHRFFEDPHRGDRPWREEWVRRLHRAFRSMHWNSIRYCIGFPPEKWYEIADEEGLMIQDEFPIWYGGRWPADLKSEALIKEYTEWMRERWNHPCVVIWDAQNETISTETGKAIRAVRHLDLSGRPWDNGWSPPQDPADSYEAHPYVFGSSAFRISDFATLAGAPGVPGGVPGAFPNTAHNPVIINEYGWGQLDREGNPTIPIMAQFYERFLGPNTTVAQRRQFRARTMAIETEFWRARRQVAGVLHFCGLAYSKPHAVTSDHFADIEKLTFEPFFKKYVGDAFAPVGLMLDFWAEDLAAGQTCEIPVVVINDLDTGWKGTVRLRATHGGRGVLEQSQPCEVSALGSRTLKFRTTVPAETGAYQWIAELTGPDRVPRQSLRDFAVVPAAERTEELARGKPVLASSSVTVGGQTYPAAAAVDGNIWTRWSSEFSDRQWIAVDLGRAQRISRVDLYWEAAYGKAYSIEVSLDGKDWKPAFHTDSGKGGHEVIRFHPVPARWVRMSGTKRGSLTGGYSLYEFKVFR